METHCLERTRDAEITRAVRQAKQVLLEAGPGEETIQLCWMSYFSPPQDRLEPILRKWCCMEEIIRFESQPVDTFFRVDVVFKRKVADPDQSYLEWLLKDSSILQSFPDADWDNVSIPFSVQKKEFYLGPSQSLEWAEGVIKNWMDRSEIRGYQVFSETRGGRVLVQVVFFTK